MDKILVLVSILIGSILVVENMIFRLPSYIIIWNSTAGNLALVCLTVWGIMWFWIRWLMSWKSSTDTYNDDF